MSKKFTLSMAIFATVFSLFAGTQAASATTAPEFPASEQLNAFGYYKADDTQYAALPHYGQVPAVIDPVTGGATVTPEDRTELASPSASELTNAGADSATGTTWALYRDCSLWSIDADGTVVSFDLQTKLSATDAYDCFAFMIRDDSTAVVFGNIDLGSGATKSVFELDLTDVSLISGSIKTVNFYIGGMATDPTTGDIWVSVVWADGDNGIYKYDMASGIDMASHIATTDLWGMAFDSTGTLWATDWGNRSGGLDCANYSCLSYLVPTAADAFSTFGTVGEMKDSAGKSFVSSGIWISQKESTIVDSEKAETLADTGASDSSGLYALFAALLIASGLRMMNRSRQKARK
jgi:hypothetical protein